MRRFTVEVRPPIAIELWKPQYPGDIPCWHFCVEARSEAEVLAIMAPGDCKGMPMRVVPALG